MDRREEIKEKGESAEQTENKKEETIKHKEQTHGCVSSAKISTSSLSPLLNQNDSAEKIFPDARSY
jgi:hypothetical protein